MCSAPDSHNQQRPGVSQIFKKGKRGTKCCHLVLRLSPLYVTLLGSNVFWAPFFPTILVPDLCPFQRLKSKRIVHLLSRLLKNVVLVSFDFRKLVRTLFYSITSGSKPPHPTCFMKKASGSCAVSCGVLGTCSSAVLPGFSHFWVSSSPLRKSSPPPPSD